MLAKAMQQKETLCELKEEYEKDEDPKNSIKVECETPLIA